MATEEQSTAIFPTANAQMLSHYRIVSKIGAGGMGEVWLAEDTRLKRQVALKLLPAELTTDTERVRRFGQEAQAASALSHPNIITVYDIGECEAGRFIVMELVAGRTLRAVIAENNSLETLLTLGAQMAKALAAAHTAGITHRDIKPDNIMVRDDGYVKVLDFGLARLRPATESDSEAVTLAQQTKPGTLMGTVAYMSPEQARGESVSHPSDVFALGIVLYELATGRHPFKAETLVGYLHAITLQTPAPPQQWQPKLPAALNELLLRMLAKDASQRPTASQVGQTLHAIERGEIARAQSVESETLILPLASQSLASSTQSIAVLPFANISADEENEYFCDGLAEELLNALAKIDELKVAARTSAFSFKGKNTEAREIGKTLNVNTVLDGSVRKSGHRIRINVQLVNAADGYQLWSERYDREMKDIFDVQDEITLAVVDALKVKLLGAKKAAVMKRYTDNTEAYQLYLKGRFQFGKYTEAGWGKAIEYFEQALALESDYAPAYAGIAEACSSLWYFGYDARPEVIAKERAAIARALEIDAELADAWRSQALLQLLIDWDFSAAEQSLARALALNPNDALTHAWQAVWLTAMGHREQAVTAARRARELDPFSLVSGIIAGWTLIFAERYEDSMGVAQALLEIDPHFSDAYRLLGTCHWALENYAAAEDALQQALVGEAVPLAWANLCGIYAHAGKQAEAQQIVRQIRAMREHHYMPALVLAYCHIFLDEVEEAFVWLEQGLAERNAELVYLGAMPERFVSFRHDPRFTDLLRRIGLPTEEQPQTDESLEANTMLLAPTTNGKQVGATRVASSTKRHTVGRERERHELRAAFNAAKDGRGVLLCVAGEPGIGKTTLVEDFLTELTTINQCTIARGRCSERLAGTEAYLPLLEALESLL
ncbi:MAG: protein kinase, partial [Blastocatellia bacterium]|nr:protein kinase [Blastocatellia bacterium]